MPGFVWIEGDNAKTSLDSRQYGPLPVALIEGKVLCKIWPLSEFGKPLPSPLHSTGKSRQKIISIQSLE